MSGRSEFRLVAPSTDIDTTPTQEPVWENTVVLGRWADAAATRVRWPHAVAVGPLRTRAGIDLLLRNLAANPQIRYILIEPAEAGSTLPDLTVGEEAVNLFWELFYGRPAIPDWVAPELHEPLRALREDALLVIPQGPWRPPHAEPWPGLRYSWYLPPPAPVAGEQAPHGLPGDRVHGATLGEVWPQVLRAAMRFGRVAGGTKDYATLVSVVTDVELAWAEFAGSAPGWRHPVLGITREGVEDYVEKELRGDVLPPGVTYTYGSRLAEGFGKVRELLSERPDTRSAFQTPWLPGDTGQASGRPCLVGHYQRRDQREGKDYLDWTVIFRSHDLFAGWPINMAGLARWQVDEARALGAQAGTLTCVSLSAHVYERDWTKASEIAAKYKPKGLQLDARTYWVVAASSTAGGPGIQALARGVGTGEVVGVFEGGSARNVRAKVERSGLIQSIGSALWLGQELARVEAEAKAEASLSLGTPWPSSTPLYSWSPEPGEAWQTLEDARPEWGRTIEVTNTGEPPFKQLPKWLEVPGCFYSTNGRESRYTLVERLEGPADPNRPFYRYWRYADGNQGNRC